MAAGMRSVQAENVSRSTQSWTDARVNDADVAGGIHYVHSRPRRRLPRCNGENKETRFTSSFNEGVFIFSYCASTWARIECVDLKGLMNGSHRLTTDLSNTLRCKASVFKCWLRGRSGFQRKEISCVVSAISRGMKVFGT